MMELGQLIAVVSANPVGLKSELVDAANIRYMSADTIRDIIIIDDDINYRERQIDAGLISKAEAIDLIKQG
jgi:hypothetical protein